jgi:signal transduction histidine kinase
MKHVCFSSRGVLIFTLVLVSSLTAYWSITLTANWSASKNAQNIAAQFGVEMAAVTLSLHQGEIPPPDNTGVSWRIMTGDKFDEPTRRNWSQTLFRLSPPTKAIDTPLLVRVTLQAFALDDSRPIPGDTLADQFSYLSSRIAALNTRGLIKVQISDSHWVEFRAPDIWTTRLTTVQILLLACLWIGILSTVAGVMSAYIMRHFNRITTYAGALLNTKPPPLLSEKSGPIEVREMSAALNLVNHDIAASIAERTHFLAAISHDLRTPVTRMRLRTEQIDDTSVSKKLLSDLDEITNMISEAINFLRDGV